MKTVKYVPEACKGENPQFSGDVEIVLPTFDEKYEYFEQSGLEVNDAGEIQSANTLTKLKAMRNLVKMSQKHYKTVSLKKISGEDIKSYDDMQYDSDCHPIMIDVATKLLNGFKLGN